MEKDRAKSQAHPAQFVPRKYWKYLAAFVISFWAMIIVALLQMPGTGVRIWFLDVGQGDSILIQTGTGENILIDGGPRGKVLEELADVLPFFARKIDLMVLTHPHADHIEGLVEVLKRYEVGAVLLTGVAYDNNYYEEFLREVSRMRDGGGDGLAGGLRVFVAEASVDYRVGDVYLDVLYPLESLAGRRIENLNNSSVVLRASWVATLEDGSFGWRRALLSGDCEIECEEEVLAAGFLVESEIYKAGHHGSKTASSAEFVEAVSPEVVVIQAGKDNKFRHPHAEAMRTFYRAGVREIWRNDLDGRVGL
jgi:competence protein ComEC